MKQIDECLNRAFDERHPLKKKWKAFISEMTDSAGITSKVLSLYHYHHLVLVVNLDYNFILHEWWEKPADKRGLDAAKEYLERRREEYDSTNMG